MLWSYAIAQYNIAMFGSQDPGFGFIVMWALWAVWAGERVEGAGKV